MEWLKSLASLVGRILLVLIFLNSGIEKIENFEGTVKFMAQYGMPYTSYFLFGAIILELAGSVFVILGYYTRLGSLLLLIFLIPTTIIFHTNFDELIQITMLMKNISMFGGCLVLLGMGPGRFSLDYIFKGRQKKE
jgi:putative oxidoreductase